MLSEIVNETGIPAFIFRASYYDSFSKIKGIAPQKEENIGIIYDAANTGGGLDEVITYLKDSFDCTISFASVVVSLGDDAEKLLSEKHNVTLDSLFMDSEIETFFKKKTFNPTMSLPECFDGIGCANDSEKSVYFRLKDRSKEAEFIKYLFDNKIHHSSHYGDVYSTSYSDKEKLESLGFEFEEADVVNLGSLSLEERNAFKVEARKHWLENRDKAIDELLAEYGTS